MLLSRTERLSMATTCSLVEIKKWFHVWISFTLLLIISSSEARVHSSKKVAKKSPILPYQSFLRNSFTSDTSKSTYLTQSLDNSTFGRINTHISPSASSLPAIGSMSWSPSSQPAKLLISPSPSLSISPSQRSLSLPHCLQVNPVRHHHYCHHSCTYLSNQVCQLIHQSVLRHRKCQHGHQ